MPESSRPIHTSPTSRLRTPTFLRAVDVIIKKRDGGTLTDEEIEGFIDDYLDNSVADYQASAFIMAAFLRGLNFQETAALTRAMIHSGEVYDLTGLGLGTTVDKHSTGGVGDKVSLVLAPLVAACDVPVPMVSGRGLGHTGGTLDKLQSIPGFNIHLTTEAFKKQLQAIGVAMIGQSDNFVPADKKLYALRDVTGTIESVPLICASIMSKKVASGAQALVMDVKCGTGAFMHTLERAHELAEGLKGVGAALGRPVHCFITDMNQPLGDMIGNSLEVREAIDCLQGHGPADLRVLTLQLAAEMLMLGGKATDENQALESATQALDSGAALKRFREMVEVQGGSLAHIDDPSKLEVSAESVDFVAHSEGFLVQKDCRKIGNAAVVLGAGRAKTTDSIDPSVGFQMFTQLGDKVSKGQPLLRIYHRAGHGLDSCRHRLESAFTISDTPATPPPLIYEILR